MFKNSPAHCKAVLGLTGFSIQATRSQEVSGEVHVNVTEEEQHVLPPPSSRTHIQASSTRELLVHLDQREAPEPSLPEGQRKTGRLSSVLN